MNEVPSLLQLQQRFSDLVSEEAKMIPQGYLSLRETDSVPLKTRLAIYQYAYWARIEESLEDDFSKVEKMLGNKKFKQCVRRYIGKYPSHFASLAEVSAGFSEFLREEGEEILSEVARFEWMLILSTLTDESEPSNLDQMGNEPPEHMEFLKFQLAPSLYFFESEYPVHSKKIDKKRNTKMTIHRYDGEAVHHVLTDKQWVLLKALASGKSLGELAELQETHSLSEEQTSLWFRSWGEQGIIHRYFR